MANKSNRRYDERFKRYYDYAVGYCEQCQWRRSGLFQQDIESAEAAVEDHKAQSGHNAKVSVVVWDEPAETNQTKINILRDERMMGTYSEEEVRNLVWHGVIFPTDIAWQEELGKRTALKDLLDFSIERRSHRWNGVDGRLYGYKGTCAQCSWQGRSSISYCKALTEVKQHVRETRHRGRVVII